MKKFLALLLTLALLAGLTACKDTEAASTAQEQHTVTAPTNDAIRSRAASYNTVASSERKCTPR